MPCGAFGHALTDNFNTAQKVELILFIFVRFLGKGNIPKQLFDTETDNFFIIGCGVLPLENNQVITVFAIKLLNSSAAGGMPDTAKQITRDAGIVVMQNCPESGWNR